MTRVDRPLCRRWGNSGSPARRRCADRLNTVTLTCNDGTNVSLSLTLTDLNALTSAVNAINLYPAGSPALTCSLSSPVSEDPSDQVAASTSSVSDEDFGVGGGRFFNPVAKPTLHAVGFRTLRLA
jgi:hypothetical protein